jgi:fibronectin-binding autotransporter adhesin
VANDISGSGALRQAGTGTTTLTGTNAYTGGTTISAGTLQVGNGGTTGTLGIGGVVNNGTLTFNRSDAVSVIGDISGTGAVNQLGTGTTVLAGANTYTGGTTISAGTLQVGNGGTTGSLAGNVTNNASLVFEGSGNLDFAGAISGTGRLTKTGSGALTLSGTNTYSGATSVRAGALVVNGSLGNTAVSVDSGAILGGIGTIAGSVNIASGGRVAPGASTPTLTAGSFNPGTFALVTRGGTLTVGHNTAAGSSFDGGFGTLTIGGDLRLDSGSQYGVNIDAAGHNSFLMVGGSAAIDSAIVTIDAQPGNYGRVTRYAVLHADRGLAGTAAATSTVATLEPWLTQTDTTLFMTLLRTDLPLGLDATTANGAAIGSAFDRLRRDATGDLARVTRELTALSAPMLSLALDAVSGEVHASSLQLPALDGEANMDLVRSEIAQRATTGAPQRRLMTQAQSPWGNRHDWWARLHTQQATFDGTPSARGADTTLHRFAIGTDRTFMEKWLVGIGGGYTTGKMTLDGAGESNHFTAPRAFGYVGHINKRWATHVGTSVARTVYDTRRTFSFAARTPAGDDLLFGGVDRQASSHVSGLATDVWGEERFNAAVGSWSFSPSVGLRHARYRRNAWAESGADALSLTAPDQTFSSTQADAGLSFNRTRGWIRPLASATYRREVNNRQTAATLALSGTADGTFVVSGLPMARDTVVGRVGLTVRAGSSDFSLIYEWRGARAQTRQAIQFTLGFK